VFVLCFCIFPIDAYINQVTPAIRNLKFSTFGHDLVILHEHDILKRKGAFSGMNLPSREVFLTQLTQIIEKIDMTIVAIVIDKEKHKSKYTTPYHPYHLAMQYGLERMHHYLLLNKQIDKTTNVIFEARGKKKMLLWNLSFVESVMNRTAVKNRCRLQFI
jgi:hypothetical protein